MEKRDIFGEIEEYINQLFIREDDILAQTNKSIAHHQLPPISVSPAQGKFLHLMAMMSKAKRILELGTLGGYSTIWLARALPPDGKLITIEYEKKHADLARQNIKGAGLENKVEIRLGKAMDHLNTMIQNNEQPFDFIFIDADKPPYTEYFKLALKLSHKGTVIICDNVIREGKVLDKVPSDEMVEGVQRFNKYLSQTNDASSIIIQNVGSKGHDGMSIAVVV
jgi:predicted O-methyltransferase YrrM